MRCATARLTGESAATAIFEAWYQQIPQHIFADELGEDLWQNYQGQSDLIASELPSLLQGKGGAWCDDVSTPQVEDCETVLGAALKDGLAQMAQRQGSDDVKSWRWDRVHSAVFPHNPLDNVPPLRPIFSRRIPTGGDGFTIDVAPVQRRDLYNDYHVPSYRQIVDLSDLGNSRFMNTLGQSGYVLSGNYSNLLDRWQRVEYLPMRYDTNAINGAAGGRLVLEP